MLSASCTIKSLISGKHFFHTSIGCLDDIDSTTVSQDSKGENEETDFSVLLHGVPLEATNDDILKFLSPLKPRSIEKPERLHGGYVVYLETKDDLVIALEKHLQYIGQWLIRVSGDRIPTSLNIEEFRKDMSGGHGDFIQGEKTEHQVRMRGLPFQCTVTDVAQFFNPHKPVNIKLIVQANGYMSGLGIAYFATHDEAVNSLNKNLKYMGSRYIELTQQTTLTGIRNNKTERELFKMPVLRTTISPMSNYDCLNTKSFLGGLLRGSKNMLVENVRGLSTVAQLAKPSFNATILRTAVATGRRSCKL